MSWLSSSYTTSDVLVLETLTVLSVCIVSLVRTLQFVNGMSLADRDTVVIACWTMLEVHLAVICGCLTTIKPLLARIFPRLFSRVEVSEDANDGLETIGRARRRPRDPFSSDVCDTTTTCKTSGHSSTTTDGVVEMTEIGAQARLGSTNIER